MRSSQDILLEKGREENNAVSYLMRLIKGLIQQIAKNQNCLSYRKIKKAMISCALKGDSI